MKAPNKIIWIIFKERLEPERHLRENSSSKSPKSNTLIELTHDYPIFTYEADEGNAELCFSILSMKSAMKLYSDFRGIHL